MAHWDGTITLGNILSLVVFIVTLVKMHMDNRERLTKIESKVDLLWESFREWFNNRQQTWDPSKPDRRGRGY